jgi:hypothetical protein
MKAKTTFTIDELDQAVEQLYRLRLLHNWTGCLKLESNGKKLIISQFPSSSNWTQGYSLVLMLENWFSWGEIEGFFERMDGKIEVFYEYREFEVLTKEEAFDLLRACDFFYEQKEQAYENMRVIEELEA